MLQQRSILKQLMSQKLSSLLLYEYVGCPDEHPRGTFSRTVVTKKLGYKGFYPIKITETTW